MDTLLYSRQYADLDAKLTGRCSQSRKVANNTYLHRVGDDIAVRLHDTDVVTFHADGTATLNTGGWFTMTTKERINRYLPGGIRLESNRGRWFLIYTGHWDGEHYVKSERPAVPFTDGIVLDLASLDVIEGAPAPEQVKAEDDANTAMRKSVEKYLRKTKPEDIVTAFSNSAGDCFFCQFGGDLAKSPDHLLGHLEEQYVMLSLARNAVAERGFRDPEYILGWIYRDAQSGKVSHFYRDSVRKYLRKHLSVGAVAVK
jgi:hypothetical protein